MHEPANIFNTSSAMLKMFGYEVKYESYLQIKLIKNVSAEGPVEESRTECKIGKVDICSHNRSNTFIHTCFSIMGFR